jgi:predicted RNase H-like HicB family nuclease
MLIRWSNEDDAFVVSFPDLLGPDHLCTHGSTYEETAKHGAEVLELLVETMKAEGRPLPKPGGIAASS